MWTRFMDMHSGGYSKTDYEYIYIEASERKAVQVFEELFEENPKAISCHCCGNDFSISEYETLEEATNYDRKISWNCEKRISVEEYFEKEDVVAIYAKKELKEVSTFELPKGEDDE